MRQIRWLWFLLFLLGFSVVSCTQAPRTEWLVGSWQVDSVYSFYNGFSYWQKNDGSDWATYVYHTDGKMDEVKFDNPRYYRYLLSNDTLYWESLTESGGGWFEVLELKQNQMVLKKEKAPMFGDQSEERYEIRFFTKVDE